MRGQFTAVIEINLFQQVLWAFLPLSHFFSKSVHHLLSLILAFGLLPSKLNQDQRNSSLQCRENTEVASEVACRCIYTLFNAAQRDMEYFNLQLQMH